MKMKSPPVFKEILDELSKTQIIIMAGGQGKRMGLDTPKPLILLAGKPLIDRCIEYYQNNGFQNITAILGYKAQIIQKHLQKTHPEVKITYDPPLQHVGRAKALKHAIQTHAIDTTKRALIAYPDDVFLDKHLPIKLLLKHLEGTTIHKTLATAVLANPSNYPYGTAQLTPEGLITHFQEKPKINIPTSTGMYVFEPQTYQTLSQTTDMNAPKPLELEETIIPQLAQQKKIYALIINGDLWIPINTQKELEKAEKLLKNNNYT